MKTPPGCGRPIWVDDPGFDLSEHLSQTALPAASAPDVDPDQVSDEQVLEIAATMVCTPLARHRPLWAARWVTGLAGDRAALILVMHHALTDGVGGLAVLAALGDDGPDVGADPFPQPPPRARSLFAAAWRDRSVALARFLAVSAPVATACANSVSGPGGRPWPHAPHSTGRLVPGGG